MGSIRYDGLIVEFDDRLLEHLHVVIVQKFLRGESFSMSWLDPLSIGDGRSSIWLHPQCEIHFKFAGSRVPTISTEWLARLAESANSSRGLVVVNEHGALARADGARAQH